MDCRKNRMVRILAIMLVLFSLLPIRAALALPRCSPYAVREGLCLPQADPPPDNSAIPGQSNSQPEKSLEERDPLPTDGLNIDSLDESQCEYYYNRTESWLKNPANYGSLRRGTALDTLQALNDRRILLKTAREQAELEAKYPLPTDGLNIFAFDENQCVQYKDLTQTWLDSSENQNNPRRQTASDVIAVLTARIDEIRRREKCDDLRDDMNTKHIIFISNRTLLQGIKKQYSIDKEDQIYTENMIRAIKSQNTSDHAQLIADLEAHKKMLEARIIAAPFNADTAYRAQVNAARPAEMAWEQYRDNCDSEYPPLDLYEEPPLVS